MVSSGVFIRRSIGIVIPVDVYVPGCAVRPDEIISAVERALSLKTDGEGDKK